ncbi:MAG: hypothetical protein HY023_10375 [Chloroflexi bacterium]|nr:hypothetical protein [Chloroflexota bacterium]
MLKRLGPIVVIVSGALLIAGAAVWSAFSARLANPGDVTVPDVIAGRPLSQKTVGVEAVAEVTRLHGKEFPLTSGAMATYGGSGEATLWVTGVPVDPMAAKMVRAMTDKIAEGRSPFTPAATRQAGDGRVVYELAGMGQRHFYFQSGRLVFWLAANEVIAEWAIKDVMEFYP